ncbi:MAG: T9SS type A sorting domain-containing protein [Fibromonadales bacterium]|nr:T9SS type A sorting domain-containing protein [Fibromonadales bacterium]
MPKSCLSLALALSIVWGAADKSWYYATETGFTIRTADELAGLAELVNDATESFAGKTITLAANIDLSNYGVDFNEGKGWIPIGRVAPSEGSTTIESFDPYSFKGTFDGNFHKITGLYINDGNRIGSGLFGTLKDGVIKNTTIEKASITANISAGGIVGGNIMGTVLNCSFSGEIIILQFNGGGIVGYNFGTIANSYSIATMGGDAVGGLVGTNDGSVINSYSNSVANVEQPPSAKIGSLAGYNQNSIINSYWNTEGYSAGVGYAAFALEEIITGMSAEEMQNASFIDILNSSLGEQYATWLPDTENINQGFPVFEWKKDDEPNEDDKPGDDITAIPLTYSMESLQIQGLAKAQKLRLFNLKGQTLMERTVLPSEKISIAHLPHGVYLANISGKTLRIVK